MRYEYSVIPAPARGEKAKGARTAADRFALSLTAELNRMAADGWDYVRAETLPSEERSGLTRRATVYHNMLVFRRPAAAQETAAEARAVTVPQPEYPVSATPAHAPETAPEPPRTAAPRAIDHTVIAEMPARPPAPRPAPAEE